MTVRFVKGRQSGDVQRDLASVLRRTVFKAGVEMHARAVPNTPYQTGNLRRSIQLGQYGNFAKVGTNLEYARIHDLGGTIRAYTHRNLFGRGIVAQMPARTVRAYKGRGYLKPEFDRMKRGRMHEIFLIEKKNANL